MKVLPEENSQDLREFLECIGQEEIFRFWEDLNFDERRLFSNQLRSIDWKETQKALDDIFSSREVCKEAACPTDTFSSEDNEKKAKEYRQLGEELLSQGKVAALTVAGGQGTRLGHPGPKGTFPCGPVTQKTLFAQYAESLRYFSKKFSVTPLWFVMTSSSNHQETVNYFRNVEFFDLPPEGVKIFSQGDMPVFDKNGKILLESKYSIATSPNGHGGAFQALRRSESIKLMEENGVDFISYFQVDNPMVYCLDPLFIGLHASKKSDMSSKAVVKIDPEEKVGLFVKKQNSIQVIEYSDAPQEILQSIDDSGQPLFNLGNIAIHMINLGFIEKLTKESTNGYNQLPYHPAHKKVPFLDKSGQIQMPDKPNAIKAEMFVFDSLSAAQNGQIQVIKREEQFAPIKNAEGEDSIETSKKLMLERSKNWLNSAGIKCDGKIEISPLFAPTQEYFIEECRKKTPYIFSKKHNGVELIPQA